MVEERREEVSEVVPAEDAAFVVGYGGEAVEEADVLGFLCVCRLDNQPWRDDRLIKRLILISRWKTHRVRASSKGLKIPPITMLLNMFTPGSVSSKTSKRSSMSSSRFG